MDVLVDLTRRERWDEAEARMRTEDGRKELRNTDGLLPFHTACRFNAPSELLEIMVREYPEVVRMTDHDRRLPLHSACLPAYGGISPTGVGLLLDAYPEGVFATDRYGYLPLHIAACQNAPFDTLRMLLDKNFGGVYTLTKHDRLPVHLLASIASPDEEEDVEKVELLLRPLLNDEDDCLVPDHSSETPLHIGARFDVLNLRACLRIRRCPPEVIMTVARRHPEQLRERDANFFSLPLHVAAANPVFNGAQVDCEVTNRKRNLDEIDSETERTRDSDDGGDDDIGDGGEVKNVDHGQKIKKDFIGELVALYPEAVAALDGDRRFALNLAIESGKGWIEGVEAIADAAEHAIVVKDEKTGLFPFMLAATVDDPCVTTVYCLLRRCPELKRYVMDE